MVIDGCAGGDIFCIPSMAALSSARNSVSPQHSVCRRTLGERAPALSTVRSGDRMPILPRLVNLYEKRGIQISTGLNPSHFSNAPLAPFAWFISEGKSLTNGLGISLQEIY